MKRFVRPGAFLLLAALLFCLSGCYSGNIDQYFSLPMASEEYRQLQSLIDEELASGSEYAAPIHGSYRQSVQLSDVDGDGADEALAFFRDAAKNPKINIYDSENGEHRLALSISGEGSSIGRIDYADLTGDGQKELLVSWQISSGLSVLGVYSLAGWSGDVLLSTDSAEFVTIRQDPSAYDIFFVNLGAFDADPYTLYIIPRIVNDTHNSYYHNEELNNLIIDSYTTTDKTKREDELKQAARIVYDECGPVLGLYASNSYCVIREGLEGVLVTKGAGPYFRYASVDEAVWNK